VRLEKCRRQRDVDALEAIVAAQRAGRDPTALGPALRVGAPRFDWSGEEVLVCVGRRPFRMRHDGLTRSRLGIPDMDAQLSAVVGHGDDSAAIEM